VGKKDDLTIAYMAGFHKRDDDLRALRADLTAALAQLADEKQKVANLEEYMLKGVAFRDELQGQLCKAREAWGGLSRHFEIPKGRPPANTLEAHLVDMDAALTSSSPCDHAKEAERLRKELKWEKYFYRACLEEIALGKGEYSRHPLEHANNTIESMKRIARLATTEDHGPNNAGEPCVCELCMELFG